jgi:hypothetical protein
MIFSDSRRLEFYVYPFKQHRNDSRYTRPYSEPHTVDLIGLLRHIRFLLLELVDVFIILGYP